MNIKHRDFDVGVALEQAIGYVKTRPLNFTEQKIGSVDVKEHPPNFSLQKIKAAFPEAKYLNIEDGEYILDSDGKTILLFSKNEGSEVEQIYSPRSTSELKRMILGLRENHPEIYDYISSVMKLSEASQYDIDAFERERKKTIADQSRLEAAMEQRVKYSKRDFDQDLARGALQGEYAIADATNTINILGTFGAGPCIIIFARRSEQTHPETGELIPARGVVAHLDAMSSIWSLNDFLDKLNTTVPLEITLISGELDRRNALRVIDFFSNKEVKLATDLGNGVQNAVMIVETGEIIKDAQPFNSGENVHLRLSMAGLKGSDSSLVKSYDGTNSKYDVIFSETLCNRSVPTLDKK